MVTFFDVLRLRNRWRKAALELDKELSRCQSAETRLELYAKIKTLKACVEELNTVMDVKEGDTQRNDVVVRVPARA